MGASERQAREKKTVEAMIRIYCRQAHKHGKDLCADCRQLLHYAHQRVNQCRYEAHKPVCGRCGTPCYGSGQRTQIRQVMRKVRFRMMWEHPWMTLLHVRDTIKKERSKT